MMKEKINDTEPGIKQIEREVERGCDNAKKILLAFCGFLAAASLSPLCEIIFGGVRIFLLKRRMRRENELREGKNDATH